jgi:hypothetical protein
LPNIIQHFLRIIGLVAAYIEDIDLLPHVGRQIKRILSG